MNLAQYMLALLLRLYQRAVSPAFTVLFGPMGMGCRYQPTCSEYALQAVCRHGAARGTLLAVGRLCRCHPWSGFGHDPVPGCPDSAPDRSSL